jgi:hypothetical protein
MCSGHSQKEIESSRNLLTLILLEMDWSKGKTLLWTGQLTLIKDLSSYHLMKTSTKGKKLIELLVSLASIGFLEEKVFLLRFYSSTNISPITAKRKYVQ